MRKKIYVLVALVVLVAVFITYSAISSSNRQKQKGLTATIEVTVTPKSSTITIDGKKAKNGTNKVSPGKHTVAAKHDGFASVSKDLSVEKGKSVNFAVALASNSPSTAKWYQEHSEDFDTAQAIDGLDNAAIVQEQISTTPLIQQLPFIAPGFEFRVDYATSATDNTKVTIYVSANSEQAKQDALAWITNQGYDYTKLNIIYQPLE